MSESGATANGPTADEIVNPEAIDGAVTGNTRGGPGATESGATGDTRVDPTLIQCHRKGCNSHGWKYLHNSCTAPNEYKHSWAFCESCYLESQQKSRESSKRSQMKKKMKKSLIKGAELLKEAGVKLVVPKNAPEDIKELVQGMDMGMSEIAQSGSTLDASRGASVHQNEEEKEIDPWMDSIDLSDAVFEDSSITTNQLYGGIFSTEYTYQIICAGITLYHKGQGQLSTITSPDNMAKKNKNLGEYAAWHDDATGNTWKKWLKKLLGVNSRFPNINATVLEGLIDSLLLCYVMEGQESNYFVKFGILRTKKSGRQVSK